MLSYLAGAQGRLPNLLWYSMFFLRRNQMYSLNTSRLYDQSTFYKSFLRDLERAQSRVIIESPFITEKRLALLFPILIKLRSKNVHIIINPKPFEEHEQRYRDQAIWAVGTMQDIGIEVLMTAGHHRKLAIIDDSILWEGSLNILSQNDSCEIMRRIHSDKVVEETLRFTGIKEWC
jgi:phosphatidylserine/phosphatidylglycerophosphate/cardiolipin synthase-like enzyme